MRLDRILEEGRTPQGEPIPGREREMVPNRAGGYGFKISPLRQFERFLILGTFSGTYYATAYEMTKENVANALKVVDSHPREVAKLLEDVARNNRAYKWDPLLFTLAALFLSPDTEGRRLAEEVFPVVVRTGYHLLLFMRYYRYLRGRASLLRHVRRAIRRWFSYQDDERLAYQVLKYLRREGFAMWDVLRLAHPKPENPWRSEFYRFVSDYPRRRKRQIETGLLTRNPYVRAFLRLREGDMSPSDVARYIRDNAVVREFVPGRYLRYDEVWDALTDSMPYVALLRNLFNLHRRGILRTREMEIAERIRSGTERLKPNPLYPLLAYVPLSDEDGIPRSIINALEEAIIRSAASRTPLGLKILFALDVSGSMNWYVSAYHTRLWQLGITLAWVMAQREPRMDFLAFDTYIDWETTNRFSPSLTLSELLSIPVSSGGTDVSVPIEWALEKGREYDMIVIFTDEETWAGDEHPAQTLTRYRRKVKPDTRLVVIAASPTAYSVGDPKDPLTLQVVGFDPTVMDVMATFYWLSALE